MNSKFLPHRNITRVRRRLFLSQYAFNQRLAAVLFLLTLINVLVLYSKTHHTSPDAVGRHPAAMNSGAAAFIYPPMYNNDNNNNNIKEEEEKGKEDVQLGKKQQQQEEQQEEQEKEKEKEGNMYKYQQKTSSPSLLLLRRQFDTFTQLNPTFSLFPAGFSNMTWEAACAEYTELLQQSVGEVMQGSKSFKNIHAYKHHGVLLPNLTNDNNNNNNNNLDRVWIPGAIPQQTPELIEFYKQEIQLAEYDTKVYNTLRRNIGSVEFCDPADADYTPSKDMACLAYLNNPANWIALKPMSSVLSTGRTIKMLLSFRHLNITAVVKLSQTRFLLEPVSEVIAFHVDRVLGFRRVPPTAWVQIPVNYIKAAAATLGPFYVRWMEEAVLSTRQGKSITTQCKDQRLADVMHIKNPQCIFASVQLWMWDVDALHSTVFADFVQQLPALPITHEVEYNNNNNDNNEYSTETTTTLMSAAAMRDLAAREQWDQLAFDAIIGNADRWMGHNTFVLASCEGDWPCQIARKTTRMYEPRSKSKRRFIYIDQGSAFYRHGLLNSSVFAEYRKTPYCRVHRQTLERIERIALFALKAMKTNTVNSINSNNSINSVNSTISADMPVIARTTLGEIAIAEAKRVESSIYKYLLLPRLPAKVGVIMPHVLIKRACRRVWDILAHRTRCLESNETNIFF